MRSVRSSLHHADEEAIDHDPVAGAVPWAVAAAREQSGEPVHWVMPRADLAARRFDRACTSIFRNP
ncbi:hypothetical protein ACWEIJ_23195 [Lentzea sp. NPDC004789]